MEPAPPAQARRPLPVLDTEPPLSRSAFSSMPGHGPSFGTDSIVHENFLEISPNIFSAFDTGRPPVALYCLSPVWGIPMLLCRAKEPMTLAEQAEMASLSERRLLFLSRREYALFAGFLSRRLGVLLSEDRLSPRDAAHVFFLAVAESLTAFFERPVARTLDKLRSDLAILCEYLWADRSRALGLIECLAHMHSLVNHSVKVCFMGLALYNSLYAHAQARDDMTGLALGLALHDFGALRSPEYTLRSFRLLAADEGRRYREHPDNGLAMLRRLRNLPAEAFQCVGDHHERLNGSGWPRRLKGSDIGMPARICALADTFCDLTVDNRHLPGLPPEQAAASVLLKGSLFDPVMVWELYNYVLQAGTRSETNECGHWVGALNILRELPGSRHEVEPMAISGADPAMLPGSDVDGPRMELLRSSLRLPAPSLARNESSDAAMKIRRTVLEEGYPTGTLPTATRDSLSAGIPLTDLLSRGVALEQTSVSDSPDRRLESTRPTSAGMRLAKDTVRESGASTSVPETRLSGVGRRIAATEITEGGGDTPVENSRPRGGGTRLMKDAVNGQGARMEAGTLAESRVRLDIVPDSLDRSRMIDLDNPDPEDIQGQAFRLWTWTKKGYTQGEGSLGD